MVTNNRESRKTEAKCVAGVDIGSAFTKAVVLTGNDLSGHAVVPSGNNYRMAAENALNKALAMAALDASIIAYTVATGYGAANVPGAGRSVSEITCQGRAVHELAPAVRTVIDIGAQFSRVFRIDENGRVVDFILSEQCAGGSGRLLQVLARVLQVDLTELGELSLKSTQKVDFTTNCAVFIESEIISRIAEGCAREDIAAGVQRSLASKVHVLAERVGFLPDFALVGGTATNKSLVKSMETLFGTEIIIPPQPQLVAARGAALIARETVDTPTDKENQHEH